MEYNESMSRLAKITWLYYINDYTQQQISEMMHMSRTKVTRCLQKATKVGAGHYYGFHVLPVVLREGAGGWPGLMLKEVS
jgi:hypothetical protein